MDGRTEGWILVLLPLLGYGYWLYGHRELGGFQLAIAPITWLLLCALVSLAQLAVLQHPIVSGYSHTDAWESMLETPHPESWQLKYQGEYLPFLLALVTPLMGWLLIKRITEPGTLRDWQIRHFRSLGLFVWVGLLVTSCDTGHRQEYYNKAYLPAIGSQVKP
ncbi:MAG: hypothetical protein M3Y54_19185 [Bacteroidota bacterium]|nr:hypothetical protein [Bacteroidota bacterium]